MGTTVLATRDPIFGAIPAFLALLLAVLAAGGLSAAHAWRLYRLLRLGGPAPRLDQPAQRARGLLAHVLGQGRLFAEPYSGVMHACIFWGFLVITITTADMLLTGLVPGLELAFISRNPVLLVTVETFQALVLLALGMAAFQRLVLRPRRLSYNADAYLILSLIAALMVTAFLASSTLIAYEARSWHPWSYISWQLAPVWAGLEQDSLVLLHRTSWWIHALIVLAFLAYLPHSKHLHIVTAPFNVWFRNLAPRGALPPRDVEAALEAEQPLGAGEVTGLTWKDLLDTYTCTECGRCEAVCPASRTGKSLSPKALILDLKHHLLAHGAGLLLEGRRQKAEGRRQKADARPRLVGDVIADEVLWDCTTCRACVDACPVFVDHLPKIVEMRRHLVMDETRFGQDAQRLFDNLEASGNPWRFPRPTRADWAAGLSIPILGTDVGADDVDVVYWVGCAGAYDERYQKVARTFARLLQQAGVRFAILGPRETCTGDPARRAGHEYLYQLLARENVDTLRRLDVRKIVATCPHCFNALKEEYPQLGGQYEVVHHSQLLTQLLREGRLRPPERREARDSRQEASGERQGAGVQALGRSGEVTITYHDPCYIGRYHGLYDQPREVLRACPGLTLHEIPAHNRQRAMCCGAGGGRAFLEERRGTRINRLRLEQAEAAGPGVIATSCPWCIMMLEDATGAKGSDDRLPVQDVCELLAQALDGRPSQGAPASQPPTA